MTNEAYQPPPENDLVRVWARVVLATLIAMGVVGWWASDAEFWLKVGLSVVTAVIEIWGFNAAVQWSRALAREGVALPFAYWTFNVVGSAGWTIFSIYHALGMIAGDSANYLMGAAATPAYVAFTCLALALPFNEWAIDRVERAPLRPPPVQAVATAPQPSVETMPPRASEQSARRVAKALSGQRPRGAGKRRGDGEQRAVATRGPPLSEQEIRDAVAGLTQRGEIVSLRSVAGYHDVPVSRVDRSPFKALLKAA